MRFLVIYGFHRDEKLAMEIGKLLEKLYGENVMEYTGEPSLTALKDYIHKSRLRPEAVLVLHSTEDDDDDCRPNMIFYLLTNEKRKSIWEVLGRRLEETEIYPGFAASLQWEIGKEPYDILEVEMVYKKGDNPTQIFLEWMKGLISEIKGIEPKRMVVQA